MAFDVSPPRDCAVCSRLAEYRAAVVDTPTLRQAWLALGREYTRQGQKAEADKCLAIFRQLEDRDNARRDKK